MREVHSIYAVTSTGETEKRNQTGGSVAGSFVMAKHFCRDMRKQLAQKEKNWDPARTEKKENSNWEFLGVHCCIGTYIVVFFKPSSLQNRVLYP
jgi:hypothetical protein